jgi:hypothetical protein
MQSFLSDLLGEGLVPYGNAFTVEVDGLICTFDHYRIHLKRLIIEF